MFSRSNSVLLFLIVLVAACLSPEERRERFHESAEKAIADGDLARAVSVLEAGLAYDPRDLNLRLRLAEIHAEHLNFPAACRTLSAKPQDVAADWNFRRQLARCRLETGRLGQAGDILLVLERAGELEDGLLDTWLDQAAERFHPPAQRYPAAWHRGWLERLLAAGHLEDVMSRIDRDNLGRAHLDMADRDQLLNRVLEEAVHRPNIDFLKPHLSTLRRQETPVRLLLEHRLIAAERPGKAAQIEDRFLDLFPDHPARFAILLAKARREVRRGQPERGLALADEAVALNPDHPDPFVERGIALRALGRENEAVLAFELALGLAPDHPVARQLRTAGAASPERPILIQLDSVVRSLP